MLKRDYFYGNKNGVAKMFENILSPIEQQVGFDEEIKKAIVRRTYDLIWYSGIPYAKKYLKLVMNFCAKDNLEKEKLRATKAVALQSSQGDVN